MSTFAVAFKEHVRRLARKELRADTAVLRRASAVHRRDIASLKRTLAALQKQIARVSRGAASGGAPALVASLEDGIPAGTRFSARSVRAQRKRLGLSAAGFGKLVGVSPLTIYHWESGKATPRRKQIGAFIAIRGITKQEAAQRVEGTSRRGRKTGRGK